jgi:hypothetical protein
VSAVARSLVTPPCRSTPNGIGLLGVVLGAVVLVLAAGCTANHAATGATPGSARHATTPPAIDTATQPVAETDQQALPGDVHSKAAGQTKANQLLTLVRLPDGSAQAPPASSPLLQYQVAAPPADPAAVVDVTQWWTVPGSPAQFAAYLHTLAVPGLTPGNGFAGDSRQAADVTFVQPDLASYDDASVAVEYVQDGDHVDARIDGLVVWLAPRTPLETLATSLRTATLTYTFTEQTPPPFGGGDTTPKPAHARRTVTGAALRNVVTIVDQSPPDGPWARSCPPGIDEFATLTLDQYGHKVVLQTGTGTCGDLLIRVDGRLQLPQLRDGYKLMQEVYAILGIEHTPIPRVRPQGPPVTTAAPRITVLEHNKVQAQRIGDKALQTFGLYAPQDAKETGQQHGALRPTYTGPGRFVDRSWFYTVKGRRADLVAWLRQYVPQGYVLAQPSSSPKGVRLVLEPKDTTQPVAAVVWITLAQRGGSVDWRVDAYTSWEPKKA